MRRNEGEEKEERGLEGSSRSTKRLEAQIEPRAEAREVGNCTLEKSVKNYSWHFPVWKTARVRLRQRIINW